MSSDVHATCVDKVQPPGASTSGFGCGKRFKLGKIIETIKANKLRFFAGGAGIALLLGGIGAASAAIYSSSDSTAMYAASGHVEIHVTQGVSVHNILPGVNRSAPVTFDNTKSTAPVELSLTSVAGAHVSNPNGGDVSQLKVELVDSTGKVLVDPVPFTELANYAPYDLKIQVPAGQSWAGSLVFSLPTSAGNDTQDLAAYYNAVTFTGTQVVQ